MLSVCLTYDECSEVLAFIVDVPRRGARDRPPPEKEALPAQLASQPAGEYAHGWAVDGPRSSLHCSPPVAPWCYEDLPSCSLEVSFSLEKSQSGPSHWGVG